MGLWRLPTALEVLRFREDLRGNAIPAKAKCVALVGRKVVTKSLMSKSLSPELVYDENFANMEHRKKNTKLEYKMLG